MIFPKEVRPGDLIALTAPSSPITNEEAERCVSFIEHLGYRVKAGSSLTSMRHGYKAGTGADRAAELNAMFSDPEVRAIFCVRGGDSSCHAVEFVNLDIVRANPKIFVGYSDITNYHTLFNRAGLITFHGPMVKSDMIKREFKGYYSDAFWKILNMSESVTLENPSDTKIKRACTGRAEGRLTGGNLSLIVSMLGTPYQIDTKDKILFIEDVNENVQRVDRMLHQLKFSGKLSDSAGVIVGSFDECKNSRDVLYQFEDLVLDFFSDYGKPALYNIQAGHCSPTATLPLGAMCAIDADANSVTFFRR